VRIVYAGVALAAAVFALIRSRSRPAMASRATLFAALTLLVWAVAAIELLWLPILPSALSEGMVRGGVGLVLWATLGVIAVSVADEVRRVRP
jgi:hypothetical protein